MERIKIGFIGCGGIARARHVPELAENANTELSAFCDVIPDRAQYLADLYGGNIYTDYREVLKRGDIDAIFVLCRNDMHAVITIDALNASKHVMCEKPMAATEEQCKQMIKAAEMNKRLLMIGHNQRLLPAHIKAREIIKSGEYGKVISFRTTFGHTGCENFSIDGSATWLFKKEPAVFGTLADLGVHKADLIRYLLGENITEVSAFAGILAKKDDKNKMIEVEDNACCLFRTESNIIGTLTASWTYEIEDNSTKIYFEKAIMSIYDDPVNDIIISFRDGKKKKYKLGGIQTNENQFKSGIPDEFINSIIENREPIIKPEDGLQAIRIILACLESAETGQKILL